MPKIGDLVHVRHAYGEDRKVACGTIVDIQVETDLFSEKYAVLEENTYFHVLCDGEVKTFDDEEYVIEVVNESR
tara:strand:+ start:1262 stop:1483 length:222 start_codon:yes stop_codon:yes gene_type:complete